MSTSMLVSKIESAAKDQGIDIEVAAYPLTQAEKGNRWMGCCDVRGLK